MDVIASTLSDSRQLAEVLSIASSTKPDAIVAEFPGKKVGDDDLLGVKAQGYVPYWESIDAADHGLPQARRRPFMVAIRADIKPTFISFPFPEPSGKGVVIGGFLDKDPGEGLAASQGAMDYRIRRNLANERNGVGFRVDVLGPSGTCPALTPRYAKGDEFLVENPIDGVGPRRLSIPEISRIMGFPEGCKVPPGRPEAIRALCSSTCPPVAAALAGELCVWLSR
jgi:site-specific DNA-cytosine methylase